MRSKGLPLSIRVIRRVSTGKKVSRLMLVGETVIDIL
jgi:hypothetical protein